MTRKSSPTDRIPPERPETSAGQMPRPKGSRIQPTWCERAICGFILAGVFVLLIADQYGSEIYGSSGYNEILSVLVEDIAPWLVWPLVAFVIGSVLLPAFFFWHKWRILLPLIGGFITTLTTGVLAGLLSYLIFHEDSDPGYMGEATFIFSMIVGFWIAVIPSPLVAFLSLLLNFVLTRRRNSRDRK
ncbi:hypothetical protein O4H49_03245 [Kiloniella laminariae]|uniref:DNA translocase FtsK 4TM region domain-containing protein n=1 Tax=Kiloniella laminariae TaxID=454162 RepID=A0ABT4LF98_9PROT|nr:hypothetical protein [Kiloniella laminariae]MCZ4279779.1 hypothetical protein [Kiloniella laminariae]